MTDRELIERLIDALQRVRPTFVGLPATCDPIDAAIAEARAALAAPVVPEGFALVPIEPTQEMLNAGYEAGKDSAWSYKNCYAAMIDAALQPKEPT